jgi:hypothetical protein
MKPLDGLDRAIDHVAAQLTRVDDDPALAARIAASLPERITWLGWLSHSWAPRLAMLAIVVAAGWLGTRGEAPMVPTPAEPQASIVATPAPFAPPLVETMERSARVEPLKRREPKEAARPLDFERSLPPIAAVAALEFESLMPASLPEDAPLTVEPLALVTLPLASDVISPR